MFTIRARPILKTTFERSALLCSEVRPYRQTDRVHLLKAWAHILENEMTLLASLTDRLSELTAGLVGPPGPRGRGMRGTSGKPGPRGPMGNRAMGVFPLKSKLTWFHR